MSGAKLILVGSDRKERHVRLQHDRQRERQLYDEYEAASEHLEKVIESHAPGRVQGALDLYIAAALKLEQFLLGTESHSGQGVALKRAARVCHY